MRSLLGVQILKRTRQTKLRAVNVTYRNNGFSIGSFKTNANRQPTEVIAPFSRRSWGGTRDKPKNVCVGGYLWHGEINLQSKHNLISHVAKVKATRSAHSMTK